MCGWQVKLCDPLVTHGRAMSALEMQRDSSDNQFGFKKRNGCRPNHAIYTLHNVVNHYVDGGCTVNLCSIDLSKAFDKVDHCALFMKLMKRQIPLKLLDTLVFLLQNSWSCVKWKSVFSQFLDWITALDRDPFCHPTYLLSM